MIDVVRLRNVQQELGFADLLEIGLNLDGTKWRARDLPITIRGIYSCSYRGILTNLPETMQPNMMLNVSGI